MTPVPSRRPIRLKGLTGEAQAQVVEEKLIQLDLKKFENYQSHTLSGGNKRKLSVAIALIGNPPIIFLGHHTLSLACFGL